MITINLLPNEIRENISFSKKNKKIVVYSKALIILSLFILTAFGICWITLVNSNNFFLSQVNESDKVIKDYQPVIDEQKHVEEKLKNAEKIKSSYKYWTKFNANFYSTVPEGIYLSYVTTTGDTATVNGYSLDKKTIGQFRDALENTEAFSSVNIELIKEGDDPTNPGRIANFFNISAKIESAATSKGAVK